MRRLTSFWHRAARRHAKRSRAGERTKGQEQLPCSGHRLLSQDLVYLSQQLHFSRRDQQCGLTFQGRSSQQLESQHCSSASTFLSGVLSRQTRQEYAFTVARHFSASVKGPWEGPSSAEESHKQSPQPYRPPAGHTSHRQPSTQAPWQLPRVSVCGPLDAALPQQSRPVTAFAPGAQKPGQRPQQDSLDWDGAALSKNLAQRLNPEGDADVRVVSEDKTHRVMLMSAAVKLAKRERMDLLPVALNARPPVYRLGDANEAAKQARLRERDLRRKEMENRRKTLMKEVKIGPNTQENDLKMKLDKAKDMVEKMYRVRLFIPYRMKDKDAATRMLQRLREICTGFANVAGPEGIEKLPANTVVVYLSPKT